MLRTLVMSDLQIYSLAPPFFNTYAIPLPVASSSSQRLPRRYREAVTHVPNACLQFVARLNCGSETHAEEFEGVAGANSPQKGPVSARSANAKIEK